MQRFRRLRFLFSQKLNRETAQVRQKILEQEKQTIQKTTPSYFYLFCCLAALPTCYYVNEMLSVPYNQVSPVLNKFYCYLHSYNSIWFTCSLFLCRIRYRCPSAKNMIKDATMKRVVLPLLFNIIAFAIPNNESKYMAAVAFVTQSTTMWVETIYANLALIPYWLFAARYTLFLFNLVAIIIANRVAARLEARRQTHEEEFIREIEQEKSSGE